MVVVIVAAAAIAAAQKQRQVVNSYLEVSFGGEGLLTNGAAEWLITRVCPHVYLQGRAGREVLIAYVAQMFIGLQACKHTHKTHMRPPTG